MKNVRPTTRLSRLLGTAIIAAAVVGALLVAPLGAAAGNGEAESGSQVDEPSSEMNIIVNGSSDAARNNAVDEDDATEEPQGDADQLPEEDADDGADEGDMGEGDVPEDIEGNEDSEVPPDADDDESTLDINVEEILAFVADGQSLGDYAELYGISTDELVTAFLQEIDVQLDSAVELGVMTQEQADGLRVAAEEHLNMLITADSGDDGDNGEGEEPGRGDDTDDDTDDGADTGDLNDDAFGALDTIAELTGTSVDDVTAAVMEGRTLVDFAAEHGVSETDLVAAIIADVEAQIAADVESGLMTQEQADQILANLDQIVTSVVNTANLGETIDDFEDCDPLPPMDGATGDSQSLAPEQVCPAG